MGAHLVSDVITQKRSRLEFARRSRQNRGWSHTLFEALLLWKGASVSQSECESDKQYLSGFVRGPVHPHSERISEIGKVGRRGRKYGEKVELGLLELRNCMWKTQWTLNEYVHITVGSRLPLFDFFRQFKPPHGFAKLSARLCRGATNHPN